MASFLPPIERPKGILHRLAYAYTRRQFGKVPAPVSVHSARMPSAFLFFTARISRLDKKLRIGQETAQLVREMVARTNSCLFCMDIGRWFVMKDSPHNLARVDALPEYKTSPLFSEAERAALDYAAELTENKTVVPETFARLSRYYSEKEICDIVWLVASEHYYNLVNHGLNIDSDGLCDLRQRDRLKASPMAQAG